MGAGYGEELRVRVLGAIDKGMSKWQAHKTFALSRSTIDRWLKLREETGSVRELVGAKRGRKATLADTPKVHEFFERHQEKTLTQMVEAWRQEHGESFTINAFHKALRRLGYSRKKRPNTTESGAWLREIAFSQR